LVDIQSELLSGLQTRIVVPLTKLTALRKKPIRDLTPIVNVGGSQYLLLVPQLAGISINELGPLIGSIAAHRDEVIAAMDFLVTGV
jgi:toxin CcdB